MLKIDGIPPRLTEQLCEELICQQYWHQGKLVQAVDILFLKVNGRWHQLYFDAGMVFWRLQQEAPVEQQAGEIFAYPLINIGEKFAIQNDIITDCITETLGAKAHGLPWYLKIKALYSLPITIIVRGCSSSSRES